jgi:dTDP-L-rhamnose 4-epimerase
MARGLYRDADGALVQEARRQPRTGEEQSWDPLDAQGRPLTPVATPEWKTPDLASIYALTNMCRSAPTMIMAGAYGMEGVCLRLFNVYGPGQALSKPYNGVLAIFASRLLERAAADIFEDGEQAPFDFVYVGGCRPRFCGALGAPRSQWRDLEHRLRP